MRAKKPKILPLFWIFTRGNPEIIAQFWCHHVRLCLSYLHANFADMPTKLTYSKIQKTWFFGLFLTQKSVFLRFYPGKLRDIASKPLLIDSMVKNTSRKVYLESLTYRAENARKSFY